MDEMGQGKVGKPKSWADVTLEELENEIKGWRDGESVIEAYAELFVEWAINELCPLSDYVVSKKQPPSGLYPVHELTFGIMYCTDTDDRERVWKLFRFEAIDSGKPQTVVTGCWLENDDRLAGDTIVTGGFEDYCELLTGAVDVFGGRVVRLPQWDKSTPDAQTAPDAVKAKAPRVPSRPADLRKWRKVWQKIRPQVENGVSNPKIADWLCGQPEHLRYAADTVADIVKAGLAGLLDD